MKIALFNTLTPFVRGGAEVLVDDLEYELRKRGHEVYQFGLPFPNNYESPLLEATMCARMLRFDDYDKVITFKFPSYCVHHSSKVIWMFHQFRQIYELFGKEYGLADDNIGNTIKSIITKIDNEDISTSRRIFTNAREVTNRLKKYNGIESKVLNPPLRDFEKYYNDDYGDYIFYPSRITNIKRQHLAIEAMKHVKSGVKLIIAGKCDEDGYIHSLQDLIKKNNLGGKVQIENRWISEDEKYALLAKSLGVIYIPYKEDSCGFVTMEGFYASKAVITCSDSGGTLEMVEDSKTGFVVSPNASDIANAMDKLFTDKDIAKSSGSRAKEEIEIKNYTWDETIRRLLE